MTDNKNKNIIVAIAAVLLAAFFMPWLRFMGASISAWDMVFGELGREMDNGAKYISLLIPVAAVLILYAELGNKGNYLFSKTIISLLPLLTLVALTILIMSKTGVSDMRGEDISNVFKIFGIGFWLTLVASIALPIMAKRA